MFCNPKKGKIVVDKIRGNAEEIAWELTNIERNYTMGASQSMAAACGSFALYVAQDTAPATGLDEIMKGCGISGAAKRIVLDLIGGHWNAYQTLLTSYSQDDLSEAFSVLLDWNQQTTGRGEEYAKSGNLTSLLAKVLNLQAGDKICDLQCSAGRFLLKASYATLSESDDEGLTGIENSPELAALAEMNAWIAGTRIRVYNNSMFSASLAGRKFDKVLCDAPLGFRGLPQDAEVRAFIKSELPDFPELKNGMSGDWIFAARAVAAMNKDGKALAVLSPSVMSDERNAAYRRYFVQRNLIEAIIELPSNVLPGTSIQPYLVLFSHGNDKMKMVRAEHLCTVGRKKNTVEKEHIDIIAACLGIDSEISDKITGQYKVEIDKQKLLDAGCELAVKRYFVDPVEVKDGEKLCNFVLDCHRGVPLSSSELDRLASGEITKYHYLSTKDIADGIMAQDLMCLKEMPEGLGDMCIAEGDLAIMRVNALGSGFKVAVAEVPDGQAILPCANLLVVKVDSNKCDPYYLKACLDSEYAQRYMESHASGALIKVLSYKDLGQLMIPNIPLSRQRSIGQKCRMYLRKINSLKNELATAKAKLATIFVDNASDLITTVQKEG